MKKIFLFLVPLFILIGCKGCETEAQFQPIALRLFWDYPDTCDVFIVYSWQGSDTTQMSGLVQVSTLNYVSGQIQYIYPFTLNYPYVMMGVRARDAQLYESDMAISKFYHFSKFKAVVPVNLKITR